MNSQNPENRSNFRLATRVRWKTFLVLAILAALFPLTARAGPPLRPRIGPVVPFSNLDAGAGGLEGLAVAPNNDVYAAGQVNGKIYRITPNQEVSVFADFGIEPEDAFLIGLVVNRDGSLYVAVLGCVRPELNGVWHVDTAGNLTLEFPMPTVVCGDSVPNALAYDKAGNLYVTECAQGGIWRLGANGAELWFQDDLLKPRPESLNQCGVDGIAYRNNSLWVNNLDTGTMVEVPIKGNGLPGEARLFAVGLGHPDGHQFDVQGNLWVTNFGYEEWDKLDFSTRNILRVSPRGDVSVAIPTESLSAVAPGGMPSPVFGFRQAHSTLFLSTFPISEDPSPSVWRVDVGVPGMRLPQFVGMP